MTQQHAQTDNRLFLLDAYALIFRGYYAFIKNPRINSKGLNTSAIMGFCNTLFEVLRKENPTHIAVVFDVGQATVRTNEYAAYKANREETPEAIRLAVPYIHEILKAFQIPILYKEGYEADDVIGTLAQKAEKQGYTIYMMTPDKDFAQLVTDHIFIYRPAARGNGPEIWGVEEVKEKFGVNNPAQIIDLLGMMGDAVDNIPGLSGVGEKTAQKYIQQYGSLENLLSHTHELSGKAKEKIIESATQGILSKKLATIITAVPIDFEEAKLIVKQPDLEKIKEIFKELEFRQLTEQILRHYGQQGANQTLMEAFATDNEKYAAGQLSLFDNEKITEEIVEKSVFSQYDADKVIYQYINTLFELELLVAKLLTQKEVCFDTETTSLNVLEAKLVGIAFSYEAHTAYYVSFPEDKETAQLYLNKLALFFEQPTICKIGHNLKYDIQVLRNYAIQVKGNLFDTMIAHYLINPDMKHGLDVLAEIYLQYQTIKIESLIGKKGKNQLTMRQVSLEQQTPYACEDADITWQLKKIFDPKLNTALQKLFFNIEIPLMQVLIEMEQVGVSVDIPALESLSKILEQDIASLEKEIYTQATESFNIASPRQLGVILFEKLKLDPKAKKTKTGQYATGEEVLEKLQYVHPIIKMILEYRQLAKLKSTYVDALPAEVNTHTKRIHTTYGQTVAATGRLSSNNPNLQNIPIRSKRGQEVRKAFIAKDNQHCLIAADYSQIELRLIAEMAQEPNMIQAFMDNLDIHSDTASKIFNISIDAVTREQRAQAKTVNFGIIYGVSSFGLSEQTGLSRSDAKKLIEAYYESYPSLKTYMAKQIDFARHHGYVETLLGRRRYLKDIHSNNSVVRSHAERNAVNAPIQGTAADIMKIAMINIQQELKAFQTQLLLQIHDELILEAPLEELSAVKKMVKYQMEHVIQTKVPLIAEVHEGNNWLEAH